MSKVVDKVVDRGVAVDNLKKAVAARLKQARSALKMTQIDLCEASGMPLPSLKNYEGAKQLPGGPAQANLSKAGINTSWLMTGEGEMLLNQGAQSAPGQLQAGPAQYRVEESAPQQEAKAGVDAAFMRLCLGACVMVHGEPFARESTALQLEYACDLYNLLMKQAAAHGQGLKAGLADFSRLETRGLADQLRLLLQMNWARAYIYGDSTRPQGTSPSPGSY